MEAKLVLHTSFAAVERGEWDEALRITHEAQETPGAETDVFARGILLTRAIILARRGAVAEARAAIAASGFDESDEPAAAVAGARGGARG